MNKYFKDLLRTTSIHAIAITFLVGTFTVFAVTFPSSTPTGETAGGLFMKYFTNILVNTGSTNGVVKKAESLGLDAGNTKVLTISGNNLIATGSITSPNFIGTGTLLKAINPANIKTGTAPVNITGSAVTVTTPTVLFKHLGAWGIGRTATGAILVNTAYTSDYATTVTTPTVLFKHLGAWGIGITATGAILVNSAYIAHTTDGYHLNQAVETTSSPSFAKVTGTTVCIGTSCKTSWPSEGYSNVGLKDCSWTTTDASSAACGGGKVATAASVWGENKVGLNCCTIYLY